MAEFVPLQGPEQNSDASWYTAIGAGLVSGIIKTVEGVVSLGAELIDLGADSNLAGDVERFFDKVNPFEEYADDRVVGKLTEALVQIGIPGSIGFKTARKLADKALDAKKAGNYANFKSDNVMKGMTKAKTLNSRIDQRLGLDPGTTTRFQAGVFGGALGETFVADVEGIGTFGDLFDGPTELDREETTGKEEAARRLANRFKFGAESLLITPFVYGVGSAAKSLATRGAELAYSNSAVARWVDKYIGSPFRPRGDLPQEVFESEMAKAGLKARDTLKAKELVENITRETDSMIPKLSKFFDTNTQTTQKDFYKRLNDILFEGDLSQNINKNAVDDFLAFMKKAGIDEKSVQNLLGNLNAARGEFTNLIRILEANAGKNVGAGTKEIQKIMKQRIQGWMGNTYKILQKPRGIAGLFQSVEPTDEAYRGAIALARRYLMKTDSQRKEPIKLVRDQDGRLVPEGSAYFEQAKFMVDDILNQVKIKGKPGPLPDFTYQNKTGMEKTKSFVKAKGKGSKVFRELFGEIEDPRYSLFNAMTNLSAVARTANYFDDISIKNDQIQKEGGRGFFWKSEAEAKQAVNSPKTNIEIVKVDDVIEKLPGAGAILNPLKGTYTTKEIADGIKNINGIASGLQAFVRGREGANPAEKAVSWFYRNALLFPKAISQLAKTVLSIPTHLRNFFSAGAFASANGILFEGLTNPKLLAKAFSDGIDISGLLKLGPNSPRAQAAYQELVELGVVNSQVQIGDLINLLKDTAGGESIAIMDSTLSPFMRRLKKLGQFFQGKYVAEDDTWKITNYVVELDRLKKAAVEQGLDLADPAIVQALKRDAADIVKNTVPNYAFVGSVVKTSRLLPIGNFMSFPSEVIRTTTNIAEQGLKELRHSKPTIGSNVTPYVIDRETGQLIKNDNPMYGTGFKRISGLAFTTVAVPEIVVEGAKALYNVTEDEINALRQFVPEWSKNSTLVPIKTDDGELRYIDFSHSNAYDVISRPFNTLFNNILTSQQDDRTLLSGFVNGVGEASAEIMNPFISESIWTEATADLVIRGGVTRDGRRLYTDQTSAGDKAAIRFLHLGEALAPSYKQFQRLGQAAFGKPTKRGDELEIGPELAGFMGLRPIKVDPLSSMGFKISEYQAGIRNSRREFTGGFFGLLRGGPIKPNDVIERFYKSNEARFNVQKEMFKNINAAEILGVDPNQLRKEFRDRQISQSTYSKLKRGQFDPYFPSDDIRDRFREIAQNLGDVDVFPEVAGTLRLMRNEFRGLFLDEAFDVELDDYLFEDLGTVSTPPQVSSATPVVQPAPQPAEGQQLTDTQLALLSPEEQIIALRNRNRRNQVV